VTAFEVRRSLVTGVEARKRVIVCAEAERSLREGREIRCESDPRGAPQGSSV